MKIKGERFEITGEPGPVAHYDLSRYPTTYDFLTWAVIASTLGAKTVRFVYNESIAASKYSEPLAWRRFANILAPACALAGMRFTMHAKPDGFTNTYAFGHVEQLYRSERRINLLKPLAVTTATQQYATITIRKSIRNPWRDSNREAWDAFADVLKRDRHVIVIEDLEHDPLELHGRMALYAGAQMNFFVNGGPAALCLFSAAPYLIFNMIPECEEGKTMHEHMEKTGFPPGSQFSFRTDRQRIVWQPDSFGNIMHAAQEMKLL